MIALAKIPILFSCLLSLFLPSLTVSLGLPSSWRESSAFESFLEAFHTHHSRPRWWGPQNVKGGFYFETEGSETDWDSSGEIFSAPKITFSLLLWVTMWKLKSAFWADKVNSLRSWLPPEPRAVLRRPSNRDQTAERAPGHPKAWWHERPGAERKRSGQGCKEERSEEKEGQWQEEGQWGAGRQGWLSHGRPSVCGEIKLPLATPLLDWGQGEIFFEPQSVIGYLPTLLTPEGETPLAFIIKVPSWQTTTVNEAGDPGAIKSGVCAEPLIQDLKMLLSFSKQVR